MSGEAVEVIAPADRTDLTGCEEAGTPGQQGRAHSQDVMIG
jgi:hypothetical protein